MGRYIVEIDGKKFESPIVTEDNLFMREFAIQEALLQYNPRLPYPATLLRSDVKRGIFYFKGIGFEEIKAKITVDNSDTFNNQSGIAIAPILFVIAILGALAAALAAGGGAFTSSTANDSARIQAAAIVETATNIKQAVDRIMGNGYSINEVIIDAEDDDALISPASVYSSTGGGIVPSDMFIDRRAFAVFATGSPSFGTTGVDIVAYREVPNSRVCSELNKALLGNDNVPISQIPTAMLFALFPIEFKGKQGGCFQRSLVDESFVFFYFLVLG